MLGSPISTIGDKGVQHRSKRRVRSYIAILLVLLLMLSVALIPPVFSFPGGLGDDTRSPDCGVGCHGDLESSTSSASISMSANKLDLESGETDVQVTVSVTGSETAAGSKMGVFLVKDLAANGDDLGSDGWEITADPGGNSPPVNYNELLAEGSDGDSTGTFTWVLNAPSTAGTYSLYSRAQFGGSGSVSVNDHTGITFTVSAPVLTEVISTSPLDGATDVPLDSQVKIEFSSPMDPTSTVQAISEDPNIVGDSVVNGEFLVLTPTQTLTPATMYTITVASTAMSINGVEMAEDIIFSFTTTAQLDIDPPEVVGSQPLNGSKNIPIVSPVKIMFDETMNRSATESAFSITPSVQGDLSWEDLSLIFTAANGLEPGVNYTVVIDSGAMDISGNILPYFELEFTTSTSKDTVPPTIVGSSPQDNAVDVPLNAQIRILFSEPMNKTGAQDALAFQPPKVGDITWNDNTMIFTPTDPWRYSTDYEILINSSATDLANYPIPEFSSRFTTGVAIDTTAPELVGTDPEDGEHINDNTGFELTFSEPMDGPSVYSSINIEPWFNATPVWSNDQLSVTFVATSPIYDGMYNVTLAKGAMDWTGLTISEDMGLSFTIDTIAPTLIGSTVNDRDRNFALDGPLSLTFSEPMDGAKLESSLTLLPEPSGLYMNWTNETSLTLDTDNGLDPNTDYILTLSKNTTDLAGNPLIISPINFRTYGRPGVDDFTIDIDGKSFNITFNEPMDKQSVEEAVIIEPRIPGKSSWNGNQYQYEFTSRLRIGATYKVTVQQTATDVDAVQMSEPFKGTFKGPEKEVNFFNPFMIAIILIILLVFALVIYKMWDIVSKRNRKRVRGRKRAVKALDRSRHLTFIEKIFITVVSWVDERFRFRHLRKNIPLRELKYAINRQLPKTHSKDYKTKTVWYWYPLYCLGGIAFLSFAILAISGIILSFHYVPSGDPTFDIDGNQGPSEAYNSMMTIMNIVPFGYILRGIHHWAAHIMVAAVFLHLCRVYFVGAYKKPRELNWLLGVGLLGLTLAFGFTGYVLPWDQLAFWAGTIGLNICLSVPAIGDTLAELVFGGVSLSGSTVVRMYFLHIFVLPIVGTALMVVHMMIVWLQGIAEPH